VGRWRWRCAGSARRFAVHERLKGHSTGASADHRGQDEAKGAPAGPAPVGTGRNSHRGESEREAKAVWENRTKEAHLLSVNNNCNIQQSTYSTPTSNSDFNRQRTTDGGSPTRPHVNTTCSCVNRLWLAYDDSARKSDASRPMHFVLRSECSNRRYGSTPRPHPKRKRVSDRLRPSPCAGPIVPSDASRAVPLDRTLSL